MAFVPQDFSEYTYQVVYKVSPESPEIVISQETRVIIAYTSQIIDNVVTQVPNPHYNYFLNSIVSQVPPVDGVTLIIRRNTVYQVDATTSAREEIAQPVEVYRGSFDFKSYDVRSALIIRDAKIGEGTQKTILVQILNKNATEKIPCKYSLEGLKLATEVTDPQHVDLAYKKSSDTNWITLGFNIETGLKGELPKFDLGELPEDTEYTLRVYHHERDEEKFFIIHTNLVPTLGGNPILGKVEWNGRQLLMNAPNVKSRMYPSNADVNWMFPMDYSTKSFDNILSSLKAFPTDSYNFTTAVSTDDSSEVYIGCKVDPTHYFQLPIDYVSDKLPLLGEEYNIYFKDIFGAGTNTLERRTLFCKFYIDPTHTGDVRLFNFVNTSGAETFIGFNVSGSDIKFSAFGTLTSLPSGSTMIKGKWYTLVLVCKENQVVYASITDKSNYEQSSLPIGTGVAVGDMTSKANLIASDRQDYVVEITYNATTGDSTNVGLYIDYASYQYQDNTPENQLIEIGSSAAKVITTGTGLKHTVTVPNLSGYGCQVGYSLRYMNGGATASGVVTITDLKVNGISVFSNVPFMSYKLDTAATGYVTGDRTTINFAKTGDTVGDPVGGVLFSNINVPSTIAAKAPVLLGGKNVAGSKYIIAKVGMKTKIISGADSWRTPYQYLSTAVFKMLGSGYKYMPYLKCTNTETQQVTTIPTTEMSEIKDATVRFYLSGIPTGPTKLEVMSNGEALNSITYNIKSIRMEPAEATYDINFEAPDFDATVAEFKRRYYAKQKRWGGNMGGGTNGNLIYFNRGEKCLILEQHGDKYQGQVPSVAPAGAEGYGLPVDIVEAPLIYPNQTSQRTARVGGLIQSVDYHGYGMFDCWFNVPKGMAGLAICLWYFHYQEIYNYDKEFDFWVNTGWNGHKYADSVVSGYGATWLIVNNEIDMELGSENTPYRTHINPNTDASISWYVHGLSKRQMIGCTSPDPALYGTWIIDWEASLPAINSVTTTDPLNIGAYLWTDQLVWVKVNDKLDEVNYGANNRSCRFNNWVNERWNDGTGVYGAPEKSPLGRTELSVNNRTPLGHIDPKALQEAQRYVEKYYDDGQYHKWSIDWTKDYTRLLIDDEEIAVLKAFVPFNPMTMLVGCWFPSGNVYDRGPMLGDYGTWAGVYADWEHAQMKVKRIKFRPYTEAEVSTEQMRYDCETYGEDGLREII